MMNSYVKSGWRNLVKNRFYSLINISGLTLGLSIGIIILLWVQDEFNFDGFHQQKESIYRLENRVGTGSSKQIWQTTVAPIALMGKTELPEIKDAVRIAYNGTYTFFTYGDKLIKEEKTYFTDPSFFTVFSFPLIEGTQGKPFTDDHSVVLTASTAAKYFGKEKAVGKVITAEDKTQFTVSGVMADIPKNSSLQMDMVFPIDLWSTIHYTGRKDGKTMLADFSEFNYETYFLVKPGTNISLLARKLDKIHLRNKPDDTDLEYLLQQLPQMHLYKADGADGGMSTVRMFMIIACLILLIACINYVNLSTARAMLRAKEISLRKIIGANRRQLFFQFFIETALLFILSTILALGVIQLLVPVFNEQSGKELALHLSDPQLWKLISITIVTALVLSSIYPALLLSSFEPLKALKGKISVAFSDVMFRKVLVVVQFTFSIVLIAGTLVISSQLKYIRSKELGYDKDHVFAFFMRGMSGHYDAVKADLLKQPGVAGVTRASSNLVRIGGQSGDNDWDGKEKDETMMVHPMSIDKDFIPFFKMKMVAGSIFTGNKSSDSLHFILNEAAVKAARIKDPIGKRFRMWTTTGTIIGVIKDFHFASMKQKIEPVVLYCQPGGDDAIYIKTTGAGAQNAIAAAQTYWKKYNTVYPFSYYFLDEAFDRLYKSEQRTGKLFNVFAIIAIFISCLGLFGLAAFTAQVRTKEIGVRKVLGASVNGIIGLLTKDFIKLVIVANCIALPIAWYAMNKWLDDFAYKTRIGWSIFALTALIAILIAVISVSTQSIKAAIANPIKSLRTE